jgi:hypothetical protein
MTTLQTLKGRTFDLLCPTAEMIDPDEICIVLSRLPRFGGHTFEPYFVAQHSLLVESLVDDPVLKLAALFHDAHEVYSGFGDVQSPAKRIPGVWEFLCDIASPIDDAIAVRFGFHPEDFGRCDLANADMIALATERRDLLAVADDPSIWGPLPEPAKDMIVVLSSRQAEDAFRKRLYELWKGE